MLSRLFVKSRGLPLLALACFGFSHSALAGFEWYPPAAQEQAPAPTPLIIPAQPGSQNAPVIISGATNPVPTMPTTNYAPQSNYTPPPIPSATYTPPRVTAPEPITPIVSAPTPSPSVSTTSYASSDNIPIYNGPVPDVTPTHPASMPMTTSTSLPPVEKSASAPMPAMVSTGSGADTSNNDVVRGFARNVPVVVALRQILPPGYTFSIDQSVDMGTLVSFQGGKPWRETLRNALLPVGLKMTEQGQMVSISYAGDATSAAASIAPAPSSTYQPGLEPHALNSMDGSSTSSSGSDAMSASNEVSPLPMPTATSSSAAPEAVVETWSAERGSSLHKILTDWCARAHTELNWLAEYDYPLEASVNFTGTFPEAVRSLLTGFEGAHPQPVAELHSNTSIGQMVLVVQARGNTNTD